METVIKCEHLTHYYGKRKIYEDLNFEVSKGAVIGLLGKNGTGKTTTINILMGYLKPRSGRCTIFGEDVQNLRPETRARIALLLEGHVQHSYMSIEQIERFYSAFYPKWNKKAYYDLLVLDDFSLGLDPGYRRLFCEYLRDYARNEGKTVFLTSHIIQDLEKIIDECIVMDYGKILVQEKTSSLMGRYPGMTLEDIFIELTGKY